MLLAPPAPRQPLPALVFWSLSEAHPRKIHDATLDGGLRLLARESHLSPIASVQIYASVGSADERPGEAGLAHFHEHMLFMATYTRSVGGVAGYTLGAGGRINAYTSFDVTCYYATVPIEGLDVALDVLTDVVQHSIFDPEELAREQEVVIEEIRRSEDTPSHVLSDLTFHEAYQQHPYRAPILGTAESVESFDRDRVLGFFRHWYAPDNLTVVATGDFDAARLEDQVAALFAGARPAGSRRQRPAEPRHQKLRCAVRRRDFETQRIELTWPSARFRDDDATYLELLSFILGECESSRLIRRLREQDALVDRIDSSSYTPFDPGLFTVALDSDEARSRRAVEAAIAEVERLRHEPVSERELERARANFLATEHFERESVSGLASKLGSFQLLAGDHALEDRYFELLRTATAEDLMRVAWTYLSPEQLTATALVPDRRSDTLDAEALESAVWQGLSAQAAPVRDLGAVHARGRSAQGASRPARRDSRPSIESYSLDCGASLHVAPRCEVPVVAARAAFVGGLLAERESNAGLGHFLAAMWTRGTQRLGAADYAAAVEDLAAEIDGFSGRSSQGVSLEVTSDKLGPALDLMTDALLAPRFDEVEIAREKRETLAAIERRSDQLASQAFLLFGQTEFEHHPYRLPMLGHAATVEAITRDQVEAHHQALVRGGSLCLAVAGDVDPDALAGDLSERFAALPGGSTPGLEAEEEPRAAGPREVELRKDRAQAHLVVGYRGLRVDDDDREVLEVISQLLAGQGGRLFLDLRDRQGLAYTVSAMNVEGLAPGYFAVYIATAPDKIDEARRGIFEHLDRLIQTPPSEEELEQTRRNLAGNYVIDQQRAAARAAHMALDGLYGLGPAHYLAYPERIAAIGCEDVLRVARRIIDPDAYTLALVRP